MISLTDDDKMYFKKLKEKQSREKEILLNKNSKEFKKLFETKSDQIKALEILFNYLTDIKDDIKFSESLIQETSIDLKEIFHELENLNKIIKIEANKK